MSKFDQILVELRTEWPIISCAPVESSVLVLQSVLSSSDTLIPYGAWLMRQAGQRGSTAHAAANVSLHFKNIVSYTRGLGSLFAATQFFNEKKILIKHKI